MKLVIIILLLISADGLASQPYAVGVRDFSFSDKIRKRSIETHVWYPAAAKTVVHPIQAKGPFAPVIGALDAPMTKRDKKFPVVLLSHGSMGLANRLFWIAEPLVKNGFIVIGVDHPGNMFGDSSADGVLRIWDRAKDISFALDQVLRDSEIGPRLDLAKVSAVGHSAGGTTVLLLAGAKFSFENFQIPTPKCEGSKDPFYRKQCEEFKNINVQSYGKDVIEGDYSDKRVKAVVALDPGFARSFQTQSLEKLNARAFVFIADRLTVPQDEIFSKDFLRLLNPDQIEVVPNSVHMTFLEPCKKSIALNDSELKQLCADRQLKLENQSKVAAKTLSFLTR